MAFNFFKKKKKKEPKKSQYIDVTIKEIVKETDDAVSIVFEHVEGFNYIPGQFITLILTIKGNKIRRAYSLCSSPSLDENPTVTVKRVENGIMSNYVNDELKAVVETANDYGMTVAVHAHGKEGMERAIKAGVKIAYGTDAGLYPHGKNADGFSL